MIHLDKSVLEFSRPLTQQKETSLTLTNSNSFPVAFKVKTTAPKNYCVRPNAGRIEANSKVVVQIILQPYTEEPPAGTRCRDKFLVQSMEIDPTMETLAISEIWGQDVSKTKKALHEHKLRCVFTETGGKSLRSNSNHVTPNRDEQPMFTPDQKQAFGGNANARISSIASSTRRTNTANTAQTTQSRDSDATDDDVDFITKPTAESAQMEGLQQHSHNPTLILLTGVLLGILIDRLLRVVM